MFLECIAIIAMIIIGITITTLIIASAYYHNRSEELWKHAMCDNRDLIEIRNRLNHLEREQSDIKLSIADLKYEVLCNDKVTLTKKEESDG